MNNKVNNKKGFTMVELLATITIMGILSVTAIVAVSRLIEKSKTTKNQQQKNSLEMAAKSYSEANRDFLPKEIGEEKIIYAYELKDANFLKNKIEDAKGNDCTGNSSTPKSYVKIYKYSKTDFSYTSTLYCGSGASPAPTPTPSTSPQLVINLSGTTLTSAKLAFNISDSTPIQGYSYSITTKINENEQEMYNSGTLSANKKTTLAIEKNIKECISITDKTTITVKVTARNINGGYATNTKSTQIDIDD